MNKSKINFLFIFVLPLLFITSCGREESGTGETVVTKWKNDKKGAVTFTFDDSTINHFRIAMPLLEERGFPGTFYIITGAIPGSENKGRFIGRPVDEIITETAEIPTNEDNFFERASAVRYLGYKDVYQVHLRAGQLHRSGRLTEAYRVVDEGFANVRNGEYERSDDLSPYLNEVMVIEPGEELVTWDELKGYNDGFHEFGSHTITHPYLSVLDEANLLYELEGSREDILANLGTDHTFSAEGPFGIEDERVMEYLHEMYPAARNRMPEPWLEELNRSSTMNPGTSERDYVQWQRGPLTDTPMDLMTSWVDTVRSHDKIWLVLVFHGVEGVGWEPKTEEELTDYYDYIYDNQDDLWIATFADVTKYLRQRMASHIDVQVDQGSIIVDIQHDLGDLYDLPLTLTTRVPGNWVSAVIQTASGDRETVSVLSDQNGSYIRYQALPNSGPVEIQGM